MLHSGNLESYICVYWPNEQYYQASKLVNTCSRLLCNRHFLAMVVIQAKNMSQRKSFTLEPYREHHKSFWKQQSIIIIWGLKFGLGISVWPNYIVQKVASPMANSWHCMVCAMKYPSLSLVCGKLYMNFTLIFFCNEPDRCLSQQSDSMNLNTVERT